MSGHHLMAIGDVVEPVQTWNPITQAADPTFTYIDLSSVDQVEKAVTAARMISRGGAPSRARQLVRAGDILISTVRPNLNAVAVVPDHLDGATASTGFCVLRPDATALDRRYLFQWVRTPEFIDSMVRRATGANYPAVSDRIIAESKLPLPLLAEQRRIAEILDKADALRTKRRTALAQLDTLSQSIFRDMFDDASTNESTWPLRRIGEVAEVQGGLQVTTARKIYLREVPYLRVANVYRGYLNLKEIKRIRASDAEIARTALRKDDLLIVEGHGNPEEIGRGALWDGSIAACIHQNHLIRVRFDGQAIIPIYACTHLNSHVGRRHLLRAGKTTSGLNTINVSEVRATPIPMPPLALQRQFAERISSIDNLCVTLRAASLTTDAFFASLQHRAFRGEL